MSKELSLETRASSAYVQGQLLQVADYNCPHGCSNAIEEIVAAWKQAEAELQALKAAHE